MKKLKLHDAGQIKSQLASNYFTKAPVSQEKVQKIHLLKNFDLQKE